MYVRAEKIKSRLERSDGVHDGRRAPHDPRLGQLGEWTQRVLTEPISDERST